MIGRFLVVALAIQATVPRHRPDATPAPYPFGVGESFEYSAKLGILRLGTASMSVAKIDTVRGAPTFVFRFHMEGGNFLFKLNNSNESWTGVDDFVSRRFRQEINENDKSRIRLYDIYADSGFYRQQGKPTTEPTPDRPLDDTAIFYFVRASPLEVGKTYQYQNYFMKAKNPLIVQVLRQEEMELPDGTKVDCFVLHPTIGDDGLFSKRSDAILWLTSDARRIPVQIRSRFPWGTVTMKLEKMNLAPAGPRATGG